MSPAGATGTRAVWLVEGDDPTLVADAVRGLVDELVGDQDRSLVVEDMGGSEDLDLASVADACRTAPFLTDRRVVIVRDVGQFDTEQVAPLVAYLEEPLETTSLVLTSGGGRIPPKLTAAVKAHGHVTRTAVSGKKETGAWVRQRIAAAPIRLDGAATMHLEAHLGEDVSRLGAILDVLVAAYGEGARLGADDIEPYLGQAGAVVPWDLTDAIDKGETEVALGLLDRMLHAGQRHPLVVLSILHRHYLAMLRVDSPSIRTEAQAAAAMGIAEGRSTFPAKKALASARRYGSSGVRSAIGLLADADLQLKGTVDWPGDLVCEVLVARLCFLARAGGRGRR